MAESFLPVVSKYEDHVGLHQSRRPHEKHRLKSVLQRNETLGVKRTPVVGAVTVVGIKSDGRGVVGQQVADNKKD